MHGTFVKINCLCVTYVFLCAVANLKIYGQSVVTIVRKKN